jgi:hypothetical protein
MRALKLLSGFLQPVADLLLRQWRRAGINGHPLRHQQHLNVFWSQFRQNTSIREPSDPERQSRFQRMALAMISKFQGFS